MIDYRAAVVITAGAIILGAYAFHTPAIPLFVFGVCCGRWIRACHDCQSAEARRRAAKREG
jgi:hypothetical protein